MIIDVIRRPRKCPKCGGEVCDILYGEPIPTWKEDYFNETGRNAVLGGCCINENRNPDYECEDCGLQFNKLTFPSNSKSLARAVLLKDDDENGVFCDVEYEGIFRKQMVFSPVVRDGICWDGYCLVFVDQDGKVKVRRGVSLVEIMVKLDHDKERFKIHDERFYRIAALRAIKDEDYYGNVRRCGFYHGKRAYEPVLTEEYKNDPPVIGLPLVILVDSQGRAEYIRDVLSFDIYDELRKKSKKKK